MAEQSPQCNAEGAEKSQRIEMKEERLLSKNQMATSGREGGMQALKDKDHTLPKTRERGMGKKRRKEKNKREREYEDGTTTDRRLSWVSHKRRRSNGTHGPSRRPCSRGGLRPVEPHRSQPAAGTEGVQKRNKESGRGG